MDLEYYKDACKLIVINLTHECNLACKYCYVRKQAGCHMDKATLTQIIENEGKDCEYTLQFLGGEPLLQFDLIKYAYELCQTIGQLRFIHVVTNGILLTDEVFDWFIEHQDKVKLVLSFDGNEKLQNENRCDSFSSIHLDKYIEQYPNPTINITMMPNNIPTLAEDIINLHNRNAKMYIRVYRAVGVKFPEDILKAYNEQLSVLFDYYMNNPDVMPCYLFNLDTLAYLNFEGMHDCASQYKNKFARFYDIDGRSAGCNYLLNLSQDVSEQTWNIIRTNTPNIPSKCQDCPLKYLCCYCYGKNLQQTGDVLTPDLSDCKFLKLEIYWLSKIIFESSNLDYCTFGLEMIGRQKQQAKILLDYFNKEKFE